ncbi:hypothetical protein D0N36_10650 [Hymenobacter lapidiphilus]|uniref:hypothetical protein n=1 Tax=Hymenobacter sp. CCM 8763 TaxID=2303334 RepID=UPI000E342064|nr:hypothetical protein [Hymenobacter sp. CCM 8763]RFP65132.1 hypothetical protein D0N36_10650 [Hymenobacter sp. CCM 8763]
MDTTISFSAPLLEAVLSGHKTVTRRRFAGTSELLEQPDSYRFCGLDATGAHFEEIATGRRLPVQAYPFGGVGEEPVRVAEAPDLRLLVVAIRVERVRSITADGARAEGIRLLNPEAGSAAGAARWGGVEPDPAGGFRWYDEPVTAFAHLLTSFYPLAWKHNAWMWVIEFRKLD